MAKINICDVQCVKDSGFIKDSFAFKITFECYEALQEDIEWKLVYVSSAYKEDLDQTLDSILVGPIPIGKHQFVLETGPPDFSKIPKDDIVGVTVVLIQAFYRNKEFIRVGYYVNNEYTEEALKLEPPSEPILDKLERQIISSNPRVTRFPIDWGDGLLDGCPEPEQTEPEPEEETVETEEGEKPPTAKKVRTDSGPMPSTSSGATGEEELDEEDEEDEDDEEEDEESDENAEHDVDCSEEEEEDEEESEEDEEEDDEGEESEQEATPGDEKNENSNPNTIASEEANKEPSAAVENTSETPKEPLQEVSKN